MALRFLVAEGNVRESREAYRSNFGRTASEAYAQALRDLAPDAICDICLPADQGANVPDKGGLIGYDAVFITGSALNLYDGGPEVERQVELARAVFKSTVPFFGSCWGLQVAVAASGGEVYKNPLGREVGVARKIVVNDAGRGHPMLAGRAAAFDALCTHLDNVALGPTGEALAHNAYSAVQAAHIAHDGGGFWGVQYHPEYTLLEVAAIIERRAHALAREGLGESEAEVRDYACDLRALESNPRRHDIAWRLGLDEDVLDPARRRIELKNFIERWVRPEASRRGRA